MEGKYFVIVMTLLGPSVEELFAQQGNKLSLDKVIDIACQSISRLEVLHCLGFIHRDIKPENLLFEGSHKFDRVFLIDFGLAKKYMQGDKHIPNLQRKGLVGTARYASVNALKAMEQSRRDDLESLGYVLVYLLKGSLPWQGLTAANMEDKKKLILKKKMETQPKTLCSDLPDAFAKYLQYVKALDFDEKPDYNMLIKLFRSIQTSPKDSTINKELREMASSKKIRDIENTLKREALKLKNRDNTEERKKTEETIISFGKDNMMTPHFNKETREKENIEEGSNLSVEEGSTTVRFKDFVSPIQNSIREKLLFEKVKSLNIPYSSQMTKESSVNQSKQSIKNVPVVKKSRSDCTIF